MIVLDTNVISEIMRRGDADPRVTTWLGSLIEQPVTTVINQAEILTGVAGLPIGRRRDQLRRDAEHAFGIIPMVLPMVPAAAPHFADIVAERKRVGRPIGNMDAFIAAIARGLGLALATRDLDDFSGIGLDLVNPWTDG